MAKSQAIRRSNAEKAKQKEIIELFESMGHTQLSDGREIRSLHLSELQEIYKYGVKK